MAKLKTVATREEFDTLKHDIISVQQPAYIAAMAAVGQATDAVGTTTSAAITEAEDRIVKAEQAKKQEEEQAKKDALAKQQQQQQELEDAQNEYNKVFPLLSSAEGEAYTQAKTDIGTKEAVVLEKMTAAGKTDGDK